MFKLFNCQCNHESRGLLSASELLELLDDKVIEHSSTSYVNAASIDVHLDSVIMIEEHPGPVNIVDLSKRESLVMRKHQMEWGGEYFLRPGEFILGSTTEKFNLPDDISAEFVLNSSAGRAGLSHALSGFCDAGWHGSTLTLELKNWSQWHTLRIEPGMRIGQVLFFRHTKVPKHFSYAKKGHYNGDTGVTPPKHG